MRHVRNIYWGVIATVNLGATLAIIGGWTPPPDAVAIAAFISFAWVAIGRMST